MLNQPLASIHSRIGGERYVSSSGRSAAVFNPATGEQSGEVFLCSAEETEHAVCVAQKAFPAWADTPSSKRAELMFRLRNLLEQNKDRLARALSAEHGKTHEDALGEVARAIEPVTFTCNIPHMLKGEHSRNVAVGVDCHSLLHPLGVCVGITPFNFPVMVPMWMAASALACGNCFILKPSERDPSVCVLLHDLILEAGFPKGVFSVVQGDKTCVESLLASRGVAAVSFVGSTLVAEHIYRTASAHGKRVQALGGAKNHLVVMPDADMDSVVDALIGSAYGAAGERCMAISVVVPVGEQTAERLLERLVPRVRAIKIGPSTDKSAEMGPLITRQHLQKVKDYVSLGVQEGAKLLVDGRDFTLKAYENGFFMQGCLFDQVTPSMRIYREEIFGPVLSCLRAASIEEAISLASEHELGNGVSIFTSSGESARTFTERVAVGMVGVNVPIPVPVGYHSFGGWKRSLFGGIGIYGNEGVRFYTKRKVITTRWHKAASAGAEFNFPK